MASNASLEEEFLLETKFRTKYVNFTNVLRINYVHLFCSRHSNAKVHVLLINNDIFFSLYHTVFLNQVKHILILIYDQTKILKKKFH